MRCGEGPNQQNHLPALLFGQALFEGGHGLVSFAYCVEELAVGHSVNAFRVGEIRRFGNVQLGIVAIAFAGVAVTNGALVEVNGTNRFEGGIGRRHGILDLLGFFGHDPRPVFNHGVSNGGGNHHEKNGE